MTYVTERSIFSQKAPVTERWVEVLEHNDHYHGVDHITFICRYDIGGGRFMSSNHRRAGTAVAHAKKLCK
jgi:hypothetical protein